MNKVLLVYPYIQDEMLRDITDCLPPLGLETIASSIKRLASEIRIVDMRFDPDIKPILREFKPDIVGVSLMFTRKTANEHMSNLKVGEEFEVCRLAREEGATVVAGGCYPTLYPEEVLSHDAIDIIVRGRGENPLIKIITGQPLDAIENIGWKKEGHFIFNPLCFQTSTLHTPPARELRNPAYKYRVAAMSAEKIETTRGCPHRCKFCAQQTMTGGQYIEYDIESVIQELLTISSDFVYIVDTNFTQNMSRVEKICDALIENKIKQKKKLFCISRIDTLLKREDLIPKMAEAGFSWIFLGIEVSNDKMLKEYRKGINSAMSRRAVRLLSENGIIVQGSFIIGHPAETKEDMLATGQFARDIGVDIFNVNILEAYKGTPLYEEFPRIDAMNHPTISYDPSTACFAYLKHPQLSYDEIYEIKQDVHRSFYTTSRVIKLLAKFARVFQLKGEATIDNLRVLGKAVYKGSQHSHVNLRYCYTNSKMVVKIFRMSAFDKLLAGIDALFRLPIIGRPMKIILGQLSYIALQITARIV